MKLKAVKYRILTFTHLYPKVRSMSVQMDNIGALSYLEKMKGTQGKVFSTLSKEIWNYLLDKGILLTAEYLPGALNKEADFQSQTVDAC